MKLHQKIGRGRFAIGNPRRLLRRFPRAAALRIFLELRIDRRPHESTPGDLLDNPHRRVGRVHDKAERLLRDAAASDCTKATIYAVIGENAADLARIRGMRGRMTAHGGPIRGPSWTIYVTAKAMRELGSDIGLRLADLTEEESSPTFQDLDAHGQVHGSGLWNSLARRRDRDALLGFIVRNELDDALTVVLNLHALSLLYEEGLVNIVPDEEIYSPPELVGKTILWARFRSLGHTLRGIAAELEITTQILWRAAGLVAAGGALVAAVLALLHEIGAL